MGTDPHVMPVMQTDVLADMPVMQSKAHPLTADYPMLREAGFERSI